ncbi:dirigent protein 1-like [Triticum urartu]|uniref:Dirigent protein n=1 Tax=Triticum urartu TaxID=4572 RepID=A0A8R7Q1B6_TRIUA|nr:dirigent protein 1-like [Triticum urartu]
MAKANPSYYQTTAPVSAPVQYQEHLFHLFVQQQFEATNGANQLITVNPKLPQGFGVTVATDWDIRDGPDTTAKVVVRAQGLHQGSGKNNAAWFMSFNTVFTDERFKGSSLSVQGHLVSDEGEWVVTGGTGEFAFAQGVVTYKKKSRICQPEPEASESFVSVLCASTSQSRTPYKRLGREVGMEGHHLKSRRQSYLSV